MDRDALSDLARWAKTLQYTRSKEVLHLIDISIAALAYVEHVGMGAACPPLECGLYKQLAFEFEPDDAGQEIP